MKCPRGCNAPIIKVEQKAKTAKYIVYKCVKCGTIVSQKVEPL